MPMPRKYTDEQLIIAVTESTTISGVIRHLQLNGGGGTAFTVKRRIAELELNTSHFKGLGWSKGSHKRADEVEKRLRPHLRKNHPMGGANLRERLIASGLRERRCANCDIDEWQGVPAPLQVDHIDGDHFNNELENLRILCPNCHALTPTWCGKNKGVGRKRNR